MLPGSIFTAHDCTVCVGITVPVVYGLRCTPAQEGNGCHGDRHGQDEERFVFVHNHVTASGC